MKLKATNSAKKKMKEISTSNCVKREPGLRRTTINLRSNLKKFRLSKA